MTRQPSSPRVTMAPSPRRSRNLAGMAKRPLASTLCVNSPRNIVPARRGLSPFGPTYPHVYPQWGKYNPLLGGRAIALQAIFVVNFEGDIRWGKVADPSAA